MNTASVPYTTALLMTTSISYSRYLRTAIAIAAHRNSSERSTTSDDASVS